MRRDFDGDPTPRYRLEEEIEVVIASMRFQGEVKVECCDLLRCLNMVVTRASS